MCPDLFFQYTAGVLFIMFFKEKKIIIKIFTFERCKYEEVKRFVQFLCILIFKNFILTQHTKLLLL